MFLSARTVIAFSLMAAVVIAAEDSPQPEWKYDAEALVPFWTTDTMHGESILFMKDNGDEAASGELFFPPRKILSVRNSNGDVEYEQGRDFVWEPGSRRITLPAGSRIVSKTPADLRRPAKTQKYELTHRDGNGEIFFGAKLEYHEMQTCITYTHEPNVWPAKPPTFDEKQLPRTIQKLRNKEPLKIVLLGDSISAGCNASGWAEAFPYQPPFSKLVEMRLARFYGTNVTVNNLSVGGKDTGWAVTVTDQVVDEKPDVVMLAFGMNDSSGREADVYQSLIAKAMANIREQRPETEFVLIASMLGNKDWIRLKQELFPQYQEALQGLCQPGVALADLTSVWSEFLKRKQDWDLTGNGVNHPNDFGHRVYAQVITSLLIPVEP